MDDLISRAAAIEALSTPCDKRYRHGVWETCLDNIETAIRNIPAVDTAPVVRCRDCKYGEPCTNGLCDDMVMCQNKQNPIGFGDWLMPPEFFCSGGERRDEDGSTG